MTPPWLLLALLLVLLVLLLAALPLDVASLDDELFFGLAMLAELAEGPRAVLAKFIAALGWLGLLIVLIVVFDLRKDNGISERLM